MSRIVEAFLTRQYEEALALEANSDLVKLVPLGGPPADRYVVHFSCRGLVRRPGGEVETTDQFALGIWLSTEYLRFANPFEVVTWFSPDNVFHPNIGRAPNGHVYLCPGHLTPGTPLLDIVQQCFEVITFQKVNLNEDNAMSPEACAWARQNQHRFPIDPRPLRRRVLALQLDRIADGGRA